MSKAEPFHSFLLSVHTHLNCSIFVALNTGCYQFLLPLTSNCSQPVVGLRVLKCVSLLFQVATKGLVAEKIFTSMAENGKRANFVLGIGDNRSDEDMFEIIGSAVSRNILSSYTSIFACIVGQEASKANTIWMIKLK